MRETDLDASSYLAEYVVADLPHGGSVFSAHMHGVRYRFAASQLHPGQRILDVGCATGYGSKLLGQSGANVIGLDYHATAVTEAKKLTTGMRCSFMRADCTQLPFPDASCDGAVALDLIEHLKRPGDFLREVGRVVKSGGLAVFSTPNKLASDLMTGQIYAFHEREYYLSQWSAELSGHFAQVDMFGQYPRFVDDFRAGAGMYRRKSRFWFVPQAVRSRVPTRLRGFAYRSIGLGQQGQEESQIDRMAELSRDRIDVSHDFVAVCRIR